MDEIMEKAFSAWIGNLEAYVSGDLRGEWIAFPVDSGELEEALARIGGEELVVLDVDIPEEYGFLQDTLGENARPQEMNLLGYTLQELEEEKLEAVASYVESQGNMDIPELLNIIAQADDIPYYSYDFEGIENVPDMDREEKYGYTMVENGMPDLVAMLEHYHMRDRLDYAAIGRDAGLSGEVFLGENGYLNLEAGGPDLNLYTMDEMREQYAANEEIETMHEKETGQQEKGEALREKGPKL